MQMASSLRFPLREKCPNTEFFLLRIQENTDQKNSVFGHFSCSVPDREFCDTEEL